MSWGGGRTDTVRNFRPIAPIRNSKDEHWRKSSGLWRVQHLQPRVLLMIMLWVQKFDNNLLCNKENYMDSKMSDCAYSRNSPTLCQLTLLSASWSYVTCRGGGGGYNSWRPVCLSRGQVRSGYSQPASRSTGDDQTTGRGWNMEKTWFQANLKKYNRFF